MPDLTTSANVDTLMQAANFAAFRTSLGLTALATTTPGTGVATALGVNIGSAGAPVLFNGAGGTPTSLVGTNITGTAAGLTAGTASAVAVGGISGLGTGVATALAVNVGSAGAPVLLNGAGGTPSAIVLTNATGTAAGLTAGTASAVAVGGVTGLGTNVANALAVNVGSAGAFLTFNGAGGTPSAITLTNGTGLPASGIAAGVLGGNITLGESTGQIILDPTLSADGTWSGIMQAGTAGATLAFGALVYLAAADSRWELADADAAATSGDVVLGMVVLAAAADGDPTNILLYGKIRADAAFPALTIGAPAYVGTTAGDIQVAQPSGTDDVIRVVGHALTADVLLFNPDGIYITHT
jgi:hypothetical protein